MILRVISNGTDTFVLLRYFGHFQSHGLKELWQKFGTDEKRRVIAIHDVVDKLGVPFSETVLKAHILTGNDSMNKMGTKHTAIFIKSVFNLLQFAEKETLSAPKEALVEEYLMQVWAGSRSVTKANTFDELWLLYVIPTDRVNQKFKISRELV